MTRAELAGELFDAFTTADRRGRTIVVLRDEHPLHDEAQLVTYAVHDGTLPDDWRFAVVRTVLGSLHDGDIGEDSDAAEWADGSVDIYNDARLQWLAQVPGALDWCDQAQDDGLVTDKATLLERIGAGQYVALVEIAGVVCAEVDGIIAEREAQAEADAS